MLNEPRILIVGAGAAGISAAVRLYEGGFQNFTVLEAKNRIGGRIYTKKFSENIVELGAQWVHGEKGNIVYELASPHGLLDSSRNIYNFSTYIFATSNGKIIPREQSTKILNIYHDISNPAPEDLKQSKDSYGEYFTNKFLKIVNEQHMNVEHKEQFLDWFHKFDNSIQGSDTLYDVSAKGLVEYEQCEGDQVLNWKDNGYKTIFDLLLKQYPNKKNVSPVLEKIQYNREVYSIDYSADNKVVVRTNNGSKFTACHVIFTASLGVLKDRHLTIFTPSLPKQKQLAIKGLSIGTANKIFLEFSHQWWPTDCAGFSLLWSEEDKTKFLQLNGSDYLWLCDVFQFFTVDYQPRVLCAWIVGSNARYMELLSDKIVVDGLYILLETFLGKSFNISRPDNILRSNWHTDKHFQGSYSYLSIASEALNVYIKDLASPVIGADGKPLLLFAGEATNEHHYSTVHGAIESGFREADRLINYNRGQKINSKHRLIERTKVLIIGAGISGLAAAQTLEENNFNEYLLIEAQKYVGGRINSVFWNKNWIDCGAQFVHGNKSLLATLCDRYKLFSNIEGKDGGGTFVRNNGIEIDSCVIDEVADVIRCALEECENCDNIHDIYDQFDSIGKFLRFRFKQYLIKKPDSLTVINIKQELFDWHIKFLMIDNSCKNLDELSLLNWGKFKYTGGPEHLLLKTGFNSLPKQIANDLNRKNVRLNCPVKLIKWNQSTIIEKTPSPIEITLTNGSQIQADCVIVTCSLGYLKENHHKLFEPALPIYLTQSIDCLGFGVINKIFLHFDTPWWNVNAEGFQFLGLKNDTEGNLAMWTADLTGFDILNNNVLLGWVGGKGAYIIETLNEKQIAMDCLNLLKYYLKNNNIPVPKLCKTTKWFENKYVKGSYSYISTDCDKKGVLPSTLAEPIWGKIHNSSCSKRVPILMFAGEATHDNYYSTVHGAYETGINQAQIYLKHYDFRS